MLFGPSYEPDRLLCRTAGPTGLLTNNGDTHGWTSKLCTPGPYSWSEPHGCAGTGLGRPDNPDRDIRLGLLEPSAIARPGRSKEIDAD